MCERRRGLSKLCPWTGGGLALENRSTSPVVGPPSGMEENGRQKSVCGAESYFELALRNQSGVFFVCFCFAVFPQQQAAFHTLESYKFLSTLGPEGRGYVKLFCWDLFFKGFIFICVYVCFCVGLYE